METLAQIKDNHENKDHDNQNYPTAPHNIDAEQMLLGAILVNNDALDKVSDFLFPHHFSQPIHARIYDITVKLIRKGFSVSPVTLKTHFENDETLTEIGGVAYLAKLAASAVTIINAENYGRVILELAQRRELINIGTEIVTDAYETPIDQNPNQIIEDAENALYQIAEKGKYGRGFEEFENILAEAMEMAAAAFNRDGGLSGIASGLTDLDNMLGGLQPSDLIIIAARPAMGKTALATNIAYAVSAAYQKEIKENNQIKTTNGGIVGYFSLEMSAEQLATRIIAEQAEISSANIRRGRIEKKQFERLEDVTEKLQSIPLYIDDTGGLSFARLAARARKLKRQKGLDLLVIDYLQLLSSPGKSANQGRVQEITEITTGLKALAKELNVPIIALSQLSRQVEQRDDKRPLLADLRESGSIEQDADVVLFIYREEYYLERKEPKPNTEDYVKWQDEMSEAHQKAELIIAKQRHGPTGIVKLHFEKNLTRFANLVEDSHLPQRFE